MKIVYVAGPYRGKSKIRFINLIQRVRNIIRARQVSKQLWKQGYAVICPHSNTALFDGVAPDRYFLDGDIEMLKRCDFIVLVKGWINSSGTMGEVSLAHDMNIPVYVWDYSINDFLTLCDK